jgi:biotin synthase
MCYAIPGRIISVKTQIVTLDYFGERRNVANPGKLPLKSGDYAYAQGGVIVDIINEKQALQVLSVWRELFLKLKKTDKELSALSRSKRPEGFLAKIGTRDRLTMAEMRKILAMEDFIQLEKLYQMANATRAENIQNAACVHGIIEFSNYCQNDCHYCGINRNNVRLRRYRMSIAEITDVAEHAVKKLGFRALVLQSGEDLGYSDDMLVHIVREIRKRCGVLLFLSIGERSEECYHRLYSAGAYGALLRFETSNPKIYASLHSNRKLKSRIALLRKLKKMGYVLATGFIIGLPEQTTDDIINDILFTRSLKPDMFSFGPLIPHPLTPLASQPRVSLNHMLKIIALARLAAPRSHIVVTTALETLAPEGKRSGLLAGANSLMIDITPEQYKEYYDIYPGKISNDRPVGVVIGETIKLLYSLGRAPTDIGTRQ